MTFRGWLHALLTRHSVRPANSLDRTRPIDWCEDCDKEWLR